MDGEDVEVLLQTPSMIQLWLADLEDADKKKLLKDLFAFMEGHPVDLSKNSTERVSSATLRKIKFVHKEVDEMADQIQTQGDLVREILASGDQKKRELDITEAETLVSQNQRNQRRSPHRTEYVMPPT